MSDLLSDDGEEPGAWEHRSVWAGAITFTLPEGVSVGGFDVRDDEWLELVLDVRDQPDTPQGERDAEVWAVSYRPDGILMNHKDHGTVLHETTGMEAAAEWAYGWMQDHPGE